MDRGEDVTQTPQVERRDRGGRLIWRALEIIVGGIFVYAGVLKALDPLRFASDIENYHILPWSISARMAFYLPWLEILCGLALITTRLARGAVAILTALALTFIAATIAAKVRGIDITCGCFGRASQNWSFPAHLAVDLALLIALIFLFRRASDTREPL